ncbi:sigma factor G inhibitor Gin [Evansella halocellulosilytica]|uniref:sigma factor G inhibitor Gin n=1 Tax=Evansella halocellulosilytica TaxID=2011013 RepID=UPI000BB8F606|nr:sigma factor G inhibitor Gin [Evansella halocellulosilytica]
MKSILKEEKKDCFQECLICKEKKEAGIHLVNFFICKHCERDVVESDVEDESYDYYVEQLSQVRDQLIPYQSSRVH